MSDQPEALRLAELIDSDFDPDWMVMEGYDQIAAELRRQHAEWVSMMAERRRTERELAAAKGEIDLLGSAADKFRAMWRNEVQDLIREKDQLHAEVERLRSELARLKAPGVSLLQVIQEQLQHTPLPNVKEVDK